MGMELWPWHVACWGRTTSGRAKSAMGMEVWPRARCGHGHLRRLLEWPAELELGRQRRGQQSPWLHDTRTTEASPWRSLTVRCCAQAGSNAFAADTTLARQKTPGEAAPSLQLLLAALHR
jgi:hypothetical protein